MKCVVQSDWYYHTYEGTKAFQNVNLINTYPNVCSPYGRSILRNRLLVVSGKCIWKWGCQIISPNSNEIFVCIKLAVLAHNYSRLKHKESIFLSRTGARRRGKNKIGISYPILSPPKIKKHTSAAIAENGNNV